MSKPLPPLILLVEDEPIRSVPADAIEAAGLRSELASNYADGGVLLHASRPALLIADVGLPDGNGRQQAAAAHHLGVPTLLISGHPDEIVAAKMSRSAFLAKPFRLNCERRSARSSSSAELTARRAPAAGFRVFHSLVGRELAAASATR